LDTRFKEMMALADTGDSAGFLKEFRTLFRQDFYDLESYLEKTAARNLLEARIEKFSDILGPLDDYETLVKQEIQLLGEIAVKGGRAVFAGAGALPLSAMLLARKTAMHITCIDIDPEAACLAARVLARVCRGFPIIYRLADARDFNYSGFDTVFLSSMAEPKETILRRIRNTAGGASVITRTPKKQFELFYSVLSRDCLERCGYEIASERNGGQTIHKSVCLFPDRY